eukprot:maker-scaffold_3-snap-gene-4.36-mRNA-1 protein AED:0.00 eAED:0.00 QI:64/1/1/1/0/0/3/80/459
MDEIPVLAVLKDYSRKISDLNPHDMFLKAANAIGRVFQLILLNNENDEHDKITQVYLMDGEVADDILLDTNKWVKGPTTSETFKSIVPKHLIAIEGDEHKIYRQLCQKGLNYLLTDTSLVRKSMEESYAKLFQEEISFETEISNLDSLIRKNSMRIILNVVFGENVLSNDEKELFHTNVTFLMEELHYRVSDFTKRKWRNVEFEKDKTVYPIIAPLHWVIVRIVSERRKYILDSPENLLDYWIQQSAEGKLKLVDDDFINLSLTFITMGHENISSALSFFLLRLSHEETRQQNIRIEAKSMATDSPRSSLAVFRLTSTQPKLLEFFYETVNLYPSVPVLTRCCKKAETIKYKDRSYNLQPNEEVCVSLYAIHRENGRILNKISTSGFSKGSCQPFGSGNRSCIGMGLTYLHLETLSSEIFLNSDLVAKTKMEKIKAINFISLRPGKHSIYFSKHKGAKF